MDREESKRTSEKFRLTTSRPTFCKNVDVIQRVKVGSDQRLVRGAIKTNTRIERRRKMRPGKFKVNIEVLLPKKEDFQLQLQNRFEVLSE